MLTLQKLLVLAAIIAAAWYVFRLVGRLDRLRNDRPREQAAPDRTRDRARLKAEDLVKCRVCGVYVSPDMPAACSRPDCPHR